MEKLTNIINELKEILKDTDLTEVTQNVFLEQAIKIYLSDKIQENKKENIKEIKKQSEELATEKQVYTLKKLRIDVPKDLTKKEASEIIDRKLNKK